jgi:hypothetical protein
MRGLKEELKKEEKKEDETKKDIDFTKSNPSNNDG